MNRHWKGMLALILLTLATLGIAAVIGSPMLAVMAFCGAITAGFVLGIAWMREKPSAQADDPRPREDQYESLRQP
jgi:hypothetical protein